jgi:hypothetical protein
MAPSYMVVIGGDWRKLAAAYCNFQFTKNKNKIALIVDIPIYQAYFNLFEYHSG